MSICLRPYPEYKDSGFEWLGQIPVHWNVNPMFSVLREGKRPNKGLVEQQVLSLSFGRIIKKHADKLHGLVPESFETYQIIEPGNIVLRLTDLQNDQRSLRVGLARDRGIITSAYLCLIPCNCLLPAYVYYLLHAADVQKVFYSMGSGLRQSMGFENLKRLPVLLPSLEEQAQIVSFLDTMNREVDRLIRTKRRLIELLQEQKQAIIHRAVTRGLDPDVRLKPSGVEWLGDIPEHWRIIPNRQLFKEIDRKYSGENEIQLSLSQKDGLIATHQMQERSLMTASFDNFKLCIPDDLVLNRFKAHLGVFFAATLRGIVTFHYGVYCPRIELRTKYFELLFHTSPYKTIYAGASNGMTIGLQNLSNQNFYKIKSIVPPLSEQDQILLFIENETMVSNQAIERTNKEIEFIREYRTRLIADVVTGKLDVRGVALPELDEVELEDEVEDVEDDESDGTNEDEEAEE